ncbi:hypothetical protein ACM66B_005210 [Microbotryomycetes sp. NB124-2]
MDACCLTITGRVDVQTRLLIQQTLLAPQHAFERVSVGYERTEAVHNSLVPNDNEQDRGKLVFVVEGPAAEAKMREVVHDGSFGLASRLPNLELATVAGPAAQAFAVNPSFELIKDRTNGNPSKIPASKPFPLSNAAFENRTPKPRATQPPARRMSPIIEKAMQDLRAREEREQRAAQGIVEHEEAAKDKLHITREEIEKARAEYQQSQMDQRDVQQENSVPSPDSEDVDECDFEPFDEAAVRDEMTKGRSLDETGEHATEEQSLPLQGIDVSARPSNQDVSEDVVPDGEVSSRADFDSAASSTVSTQGSVNEVAQAPAGPLDRLSVAPPSTDSRRTSPLPKSLRPAQIVPRPTKASALRTGGLATVTTPAKQRVPLSTAERAKLDSARRVSITNTTNEPRQSLSATPKIVPRQTRASALRTGQAVPASPVMSRAMSAPGSSTPSARRQSAAPTMTRTQSAGVAAPVAKGTPVSSTARPKVEPRMSRASLLRLGVDVKSLQKPRQSMPGGQSFEGVPGHPRRQSIAVAPKAPSIAPRLNKSAMLRQNSTDGAQPPKSSLSAPSAKSRPSSALSTVSASALSHTSKSSAPASAAAKPVAPIKALQSAAIAPRLNKSAELRQAQKPAQAQQSGVFSKVPKSTVTVGAARAGWRGSAFTERSNER